MIDPPSWWYIVLSAVNLITAKTAAVVAELRSSESCLIAIYIHTKGAKYSKLSNFILLLFFFSSLSPSLLHYLICNNFRRGKKSNNRVTN